MLRQLLQALRFDIEEFFAVPAPAVAAMLVAVICLCGFAYIRTVYSWNSHQLSKLMLMVGALIAIHFAGKTLKRR